MLCQKDITHEVQFPTKQRRQEAFPGPVLTVIGDFLTETLTHFLSTEVPQGLSNTRTSLGKLNYTKQTINLLIHFPTHIHLHAHTHAHTQKKHVM